MSAESEATGDNQHTIEWRGLSLTFTDDAQDWSLEALEAFEEGKSVVALRELLGTKQWAEVKAKRPKGRDLGELMDTVAEAAGFTDSGE